jgi:hypothetical protein
MMLGITSARAPLALLVYLAATCLHFLRPLRRHSAINFLGSRVQTVRSSFQPKGVSVNGVTKMRGPQMSYGDPSQG